MSSPGSAASQWMIRLQALRRITARVDVGWRVRLERALKLAAHALDAEHGSICALASHDGALRVEAAWPADSLKPGDRLEADRTHLHIQVEATSMLSVSDTRLPELADPFAEGATSDRFAISAPLRAATGPLGVLSFRRDGRLPWTDADAAFVEALAAWLAEGFAVRAARRDLRDARARIETTGAIDPQTGLPNRILGMDYLDREVRRAARLGEELSVCVLQVPQLRMLLGDDDPQAAAVALRTVGKALAAIKRELDVSARFGRGEFLLIWPGTGEVHAELAAQRQTAAIADLDLGDGAKLRGFVGLASWRTGEDADDLVARADGELRAAVARGARMEMLGSKPEVAPVGGIQPDAPAGGIQPDVEGPREPTVQAGDADAAAPTGEAPWAGGPAVRAGDADASAPTGELPLGIPPEAPSSPADASAGPDELPWPRLDDPPAASPGDPAAETPWTPELRMPDPAAEPPWTPAGGRTPQRDVGGWVLGGPPPLAMTPEAPWESGEAPVVGWDGDAAPDPTAPTGDPATDPTAKFEAE